MVTGRLEVCRARCISTVRGRPVRRPTATMGARSHEGKRHSPRPRHHRRRPALPGDGFPAPDPGESPGVRPGAAPQPDVGQHLRHPLQRHRVRGGRAARHQRAPGAVPRRQRGARDGRGDLRPVFPGRRDGRRAGAVARAGDDLPGRVAQRPGHRHPAAGGGRAGSGGDGADHEDRHQDRQHQARQAQQRRHDPGARVHRRG